MFVRNFFAALTLLVLGATASLANSTPSLPQPVQDYIRTMQTKYHFNSTDLTKLFLNTHINMSIIDQMNHPYEAMTWPKYRKFFITEQRINEGLVFWNQHRAILQKAEEIYGVPASIIVAIFGVETNYGQRKGTYSVMEALTTLSFHYPKREKFFRQELTEYLLLTREQKLEPLKLTGSYAGAIGIPQFMPSTYRHYAVDYSKQGSADLVNDVNDAIFSTANYLKEMGWKQRQQVASEITTKITVDDHLLSNSAKPTLSLSVLKKAGIPIPKTADKKMKVAIIKLDTQQPDATDYWITYANFHAIMRYNPRVNYAMAVYQLSVAIKDAQQRTTTAARTKSTPARSLG